MITAIRLLVIAAVIGGGALLVHRHQGGSDTPALLAQTQPTPTVPAAPTVTDPTAAAAPQQLPAQSAAARSVDSTGTLVSYELVAGDAIVIRLSEDGMASCAFKVHAGPADATDHAAAGIAVDYQIVPVATWRATVAAMGQACGEFWQIID